MADVRFWNSHMEPPPRYFHTPLTTSSLHHSVFQIQTRSSTATSTMKFTSIVTIATLVAFTDFDVAAAAMSRTRGVERAGTEEGHLHRALSPDKKAGGKGGSVSRSHMMILCQRSKFVVLIYFCQHDHYHHYVLTLNNVFLIFFFFLFFSFLLAQSVPQWMQRWSCLLQL